MAKTGNTGDWREEGRKARQAFVDFAASIDLKFSCKPVDSRPDMESWGHGARHYRVRLSRKWVDGTRSMSLYFSQGSAHTEDPTVADVLSCLALDASVLKAMTFEDWASDLGYDTDSRQAEATYRACKRQSKRQSLALARVLRTASALDFLLRLDPL